jgi:hypothetical protein
MFLKSFKSMYKKWGECILYTVYTIHHKLQYITPPRILVTHSASLRHLHAAELLLNFSYSPLHAMGEIELNPILSYFAVYFPLE